MGPNYDIVKELQNINKNLQSINQTLNQMVVASKSKAAPTTFDVATPKFREGMELNNS